ncbi:MAG TPA: polysaccharide deacetylase family protein [Terracidiphilus sp.]|nr:polysaccharide deacetylase family protein [Terracidiphilus sp.]
MLLDPEKAIAEGLGGLIALGFASGACAFAAMWPGSQIFGRTLVAPARPGEIALTFDDGPNPAWTPRLLELLAKHDVKATFFLVGKFASEESVLARYIANGGHAIGNHSWNHPNLARTPAARVREELRNTKDALEQIVGKPVTLFRPPYGARRPYVLRVAREMGMTPVMWNAMTNDWEERSAERIAETLAARVKATQRRGRAANIVLHDGGHRMLGADRGPSIRAAEILVDRFRATHRFVTVEEWISAQESARV